MDDTVRLEYFNTSPEGDYIDYQADIVGNVERGVRFILTYVVEGDNFYATIDDTKGCLEGAIPFIDHDVAKFMIGEEEYNKLKEIHKEGEENDK